MNIYDYLKKDHHKIAPLIDQLKMSIDLQQKIEIVYKIRKQLTLQAISEHNCKDFINCANDSFAIENVTNIGKALLQQVLIGHAK